MGAELSPAPRHAQPPLLRRPLVWVAVGAALMTGPFWGLMGTMLGMARSFSVIEELRAPTPPDLKEGVALSLYATGLGIAAGALGVVIFAVALARLLGRRDGFSASKALEA